MSSAFLTCMNKGQLCTLIVIPFGPGREVSFLMDTIESIDYHFKTGQVKIAVINDSSYDLTGKLAFTEGPIAVYPSRYETQSPEGRTLFGGVFLNQLYVLEKELQQQSYDLAIKMDDDALVCGDDPHLPAIDYFRRNPGVGLLGAFTQRGDGSSKRKAMARKGRTVSRIINFQRFVSRVKVTKKPATACREFLLGLSLRYLDYLASRHPDYSRGDTCTGGCYFMSNRLLNRLSWRASAVRALAWCDDPGEDTSMALLSYSVGLSIADYPDEGKTIAINWRGLPAKPEYLADGDVAVVHPVKGDAEYSEQHIREEISRCRSA